MGANHFNSMRDVQALMDRSPIPVAKAPHGSIFIVDHHHTLAALDASHFSSVNITIYAEWNSTFLVDARARRCYARRRALRRPAGAAA